MSVVLSELPEHERPRERLAALGVEALSERELLALVLRSGRSGESAVDLAGELLSRFGGLNGLSRVLPEELAAVPGVGVAKSAAVVAALRIGARVCRATSVPILKSPEAVAAVATEQLQSLRRERVLVLACDAANRLIRVVAVSEGSLDRSLVPVREILNAVLRHDGRAFAVAHNHPSGDPTPSDADYRATSELVAASGVVGLRFLCHVVVAGSRWELVPIARAKSPR